MPFPREAYEAAIREAGLGVEASLRAFDRACETAVAELGAATPAPPPPGPTALKRLPELCAVGNPGFDALVERARLGLPKAAHGMAAAGLARVVDFQDAAYGGEYLDRVQPFTEIEATSGNA